MPVANLKPTLTSQGYRLPLAVASFRHVTVAHAGLVTGFRTVGCFIDGLLSIHDFTLRDCRDLGDLLRVPTRDNPQTSC